MAHHGREVNHNPVPHQPTSPVTEGTTTPENQNMDHTQVNQSVTAGAGKHRGDQRDRSPTYTTTEKHSARGNTPRKDVSTRSR